MKAIVQLHKDFARIEEMRAAEGEAVVEQHPAIGDVEGLQIDGKALAELLAEREVKRSVRLEMIAGGHRRLIAVGEARGVGDIGGGRNTPRERELAGDVEGVALIVVQQAAAAAKRKIREPAVDATAAECELI